MFKSSCPHNAWANYDKIFCRYKKVNIYKAFSSSSPLARIFFIYSCTVKIDKKYTGKTGAFSRFLA